MGDYEDDDEDYDPLPVIAPEDRTMDTPANAELPSAYEGQLMEVWASQGGADFNEARAEMAADIIAGAMDDPAAFGRSFAQLPAGAQWAFEEALAIDPKPARYRTGTGDLNYGPVSAMVEAMFTNPRIPPADREALREFFMGLSPSEDKALLDYFSGVYSR